MEQYLTDLPEERIAKYRSMAATARESAFNATSQEVIDIFMAVATAWEALAVELEHIDQARDHVPGLNEKSLGRPIPDR